MNFVRFAAVACVVGGLAQAGAAVAAASVPELRIGAPVIAVWSLALAAMHVPQLIGVLGVRHSGLVGPGRPGRIGLGVVAVAVAVFVLAEAMNLVSPAMADTMFAVATPLAGIGLIVAGTATLRAGLWSGPGRVMPLVTGLCVPVLLASFALGPVGQALGIAVWGVSWALLGVALLKTTTRSDVVVRPELSRAVSGGAR